MQSLNASANRSNGSRASRTFSGIASFTFCPKLGLEHLGNRAPILFTRPRVKSMGARLPKCSSPSFGQKVKDAIPEKVREALLPLVQLADALSDCMQSYDQKIEELGSEKYGHTKRLRQVKGGPITALAYVLTLENP